MTEKFKFYPSTSEESESKMYICAPVPTKPCFVIPKYIFEYREDQKEKSLVVYKEVHAEYRFTFTSEVMVRRMIKDSSVPREFQSYPLVKMLVEICCEFMFTEIEIASYSIYLNRFVWPTSSSFFPILLYTIALAIKNLFGFTLEPIIAHLDDKIPNFLNFFTGWMNKNDDLLKIELQELNRVFSDLIKAPYEDLFVDYNYYVDSILEMAPASVYEKPAWQEQLMLVPAQTEVFPEVPSLAKLDSVFAIVADYTEIPSLNRVFSINSNTSFGIWPDFNED